MTDKPMEEKSREIEETVARYSANRPLPIAILLIALTVMTAIPLAIFSLLVGPTSGAWSDAAAAAAVGAYLLCVGLIWLFAPAIGGSVRQRYRVVITETPTVRPRRWFLVSFLASICYQTAGLALLALWHYPPQLQPCLAALAVTGVTAGMTFLAAVGGVRFPWRRTPITYAMVAIYNVYGIAVLSGLPPIGGTAPGPHGILLRLAPLAALGLAWFPLSAIYSRLQFRRLQQLVNEEGVSHD